MTLPAGTDPRQLHDTIKESAPPADSIGEMVTAIIKIEDGTLTLLAYDISDGPPKTFASTTNRYIVKKVQPLKIPGSTALLRGAAQ